MVRTRLPGVMLSGAFLVTTACKTNAPVGEVDWVNVIAPQMQARCVECHGGDTPAANYDLTSYLGALGAGSDDVPNAQAGDLDAKLLTQLESGSSPHQLFSTLRADIEQWIRDERLAWDHSSPHAPGILNPQDAEQFHGPRLRDIAYAYDVCGGCHGFNFAEDGAARGECTKCHVGGAASCVTCHGGVDSGAHLTHTSLFDCTSCHDSPANVLDSGHVLTKAGDIDPPPAEVVFSGDAAGSQDGWDGQTCRVGCHNNQPMGWTQP